MYANYSIRFKTLHTNKILIALFWIIIPEILFSGKTTTISILQVQEKPHKKNKHPGSFQYPFRPNICNVIKYEWLTEEGNHNFSLVFATQENCPRLVFSGSHKGTISQYFPKVEQQQGHMHTGAISRGLLFSSSSRCYM